MRWNIVENKRKIATEDFEGHCDHVEMSGEKVSGLVKYSVKNSRLSLERAVVFPMVRKQPNDTFGTYIADANHSLVRFPEEEVFESVELDGILSLCTHAGDVKIVHRLFPSVTEPIFYEQLEIMNCGTTAVTPEWSSFEKLERRLTCRGYVYFACICEEKPRAIQPGTGVVLTFGFTAYLANEKKPKIEAYPQCQRRSRVEELMQQFDMTTNDPVLDTEFAFAKLRAGESIFRTRNGLVHSPGGRNYYAAIWCNDQCEYSSPWFAFTGDDVEQKAVENAMRWYELFMDEEYDPIPSSIIAEGTDYWNGAGDRGDASMYLYGFTRYLLARGELPRCAQARALTWCAAYIERQMNEDDVVVSDSDELEGRISSGINLSTASLSYGGLCNWASLLQRMKMPEEAERIRKLSERVRAGMDAWFGGKIQEYETYHYHKGCDVIRAWNCLPIYMKIFDRAEDTLRSISDKLWDNGSCRTTEGEKILWDRSALYYIMSLFRFGDVETAWEKLQDFSVTRLLGEHVPYPIEAYPENGMKHLSAESALYCRIVSDGILNLDFDGEGFSVQPMLPKALTHLSVSQMWCDGTYWDLEIADGTVRMKSDDGRTAEFPVGERYHFIGKATK